MSGLLKEWPKQLAWRPSIERAEKLSQSGRVVVGGMGGSHFAADLLAYALPEREIRVHRDFGVPPHDDLHALHIAVSYSGNTQETLDFARAASQAGAPVAALASGGTLAHFARQTQLPFVAVPHGLVPRMATGYMLKALLALLGQDGAALARAGEQAPYDELDRRGEDLAAFVEGGTALLYAAAPNAAFASYLPALFNETAKVPAFTNLFPELDHNEIESVLAHGAAGQFRFVFLSGEDDLPEIARRRDAFMELVNEAGVAGKELPLFGTGFARVASSSYLFHAAALALARRRGVDPLATPRIDAFKAKTS